MRNVVGELLSQSSRESYQKVKIVNVYYKDLVENDKNQEYSQEEIVGLAQNIKEVGLLHPLIVSDLNNGKYLIISGHRRFNAHKHLVETDQLETYEDIPCRILSFEDELEELDALISSNSYRQLEVKDKIEITKKARDLFGALEQAGQRPQGLMRDWIASRTGFSARSVQDYLTELDQIELQGEEVEDVATPIYSNKKKKDKPFDLEKEGLALEKQFAKILNYSLEHQFEIDLISRLETEIHHLNNAIAWHLESHKKQ